MKFFWLAAAGFGLYWLYRNGYGAWVGSCPAGFHDAQDMFPICRNDAVIPYDAGKCGFAQVAPTFPNTWGCVNGKPTQVLSSPRWP